MKQTALRLPDATHGRLRALTSDSGRTPTFHISQAIERYLEDLDDLNAVKAVANEHRESVGYTLSLEKLGEYLGLET